MSPQADARGDTALARTLKQRIARDGPITVAAYMDACLHDPEHGYYRGRRVLGARGDFITAPEISQVFGELIGLWCAVVWQEMGAPARLDLVELGPGRGTLIADALRAARRAAGFHDALALHLVETSDVLRAEQHAAVAEYGVPVTWHGTTETLIEGDGPAIVIANEFLDALPVEQYAYAGGLWHRRVVALDAHGELCFDVEEAGLEAPSALPAETMPQEGDILEAGAAGDALAGALAARARRAPLAALLIDYGHARTAFGDTLQAVHAQRHVSPFFAPGETDLSHQVDFERLATACRDGGLAVDGPATQAAFLGSLGIMERASRLMAANPGEALAIETAVARLMSPAGMGSRFKALGVRTPALPPLPGFAPGENAD